MSANQILGWFSKSGPWSQYSRRFHNLEREQKAKALELIAAGIAPDKAIRKARKTK